MKDKLRAVRAASLSLKQAGSAQKNAVLLEAASLLKAQAQSVLKANQEDLAALGPEANAAFRDRLSITPARLEGMLEGLKQVAGLPDPVGEEVERRTLANGLLVRKVRAPLGVILMIFESRPNVAVEAFSLAFKSGNAIILRGGKEGMRTTSALYSILSQALAKHSLPTDCLWGITDPDRKLALQLLKEDRLIDIVVPRGGEALIQFVVEEARMPIIKNDRGLCHVYLHEDADPRMAQDIVVNAKTQRPGVCNAMETLLIHRSLAQTLLPKLHEAMAQNKVEWFADSESFAILKGKPGVQTALPQSWDTEYLDTKINCAVVGSLEEAMMHIEKHGSRHSEAIITKTESVARRFQDTVDAAATYWNASTRFTDGFELGLGGELGISTQKLHVRGPVGLRELTSTRWIIQGQGQIRK